MTPTEELKRLWEKQKEVINRRTTKLYSDLVRVAPVDTGMFKSAWTLDRLGEASWRISNNMEYASVLWAGRDPITKKGSKQWQHGGDPMLEEFKEDLQRKLDRINL